MTRLEYQRKVTSTPANPPEVSIPNNIKAIVDDRCLVLFNTIAIAEDSDILITRLDVIKKQFYSRASLISRKKRHCCLPQLLCRSEKKQSYGC